MLRDKFKFYVINLNRRTDKLACAYEQFNQHDLDVERIPGIELSIEDIESLWALDEFSKSHIRRVPRQLGHVGCLLAHLSAMLRVAQNTVDERVNVIFEDDVVLAHDFNDRLLEVHKEVPSDWDFIAYGWYCNQYHWPQCRDNDEREWLGANVVRLRFYMGNWAYALSREGARKILNAIPCNQTCGADTSQGCSMAIDWIISCMIRNGALRAYAVVPGLAFTPKQGATHAYGLRAPKASFLATNCRHAYVSDTEAVHQSHDNVDRALFRRTGLKEFGFEFKVDDASQTIDESKGLEQISEIRRIDDFQNGLEDAEVVGERIVRDESDPDPIEFKIRRD